jgi:hypothetical protein
MRTIDHGNARLAVLAFLISFLVVCIVYEVFGEK